MFIQIDEARIRDHLGEMVRGTVEEALNATRGLARSVSRFRSCGAGPLRRRSSSAIAGAKVRLRKH
jgi:hypothetical protein